MKWNFYVISQLILLLTLSQTILAQSDNLPRGAYQMPYVRYEAENAIISNGKPYHSKFFAVEETASEASNQKYVSLQNNGASMEWQATSEGNGLTIRFTIEDKENGGGKSSQLNLYIDGEYVKTIGLSSYWAWQYYPYSDSSNDPSNFPSDRPRMRFDELHFRVAQSIQEGQTITLKKENDDGIEVGIDFVELENTPSAIAKPEGYVDVRNHGAVANDGQDDITAFRNAINEAKNQGTGVYIPPGTFNLSDNIRLTTDNMAFVGAGMWHTELFFTQEGRFQGGISCRASNLEIANFYINTVNDQRFINGDYVDHKGIAGVFGTDSHIHDVWVTHFETGAWIADYNQNPTITNQLVFENNRIRNNYADGINLAQGTSTTTIRHNDFRSNSDDAIAIWPSNGNGATEPTANLIYNNTIEFNIRAGGIAIFGGNSHQVHHNLVRDAFASSGLRVTTDFDGYHFENNSDIAIYENTFVNCGTSVDLWNNHRGAIEIKASRFPIQNINFRNNTILNAQRHAIQLSGQHALSVSFENTIIDGTGVDNIVLSNITPEMGGSAIVSSAHQGTAIFNGIQLNNIEASPTFYNKREAFNLEVNNESSIYPISNTFLVDFGPNDGTNGDETLTESWNNIINISEGGNFNVVSDHNEAIEIELITAFLRNGKNHGGLYYPSTHLGAFNEASATIDYFFVTDQGKLKIKGLDTTKAYQFSIFASRETASKRVSKYTLKGRNEGVFFLQTSGSLIGGTGYNGNQYNILNSTYIYPKTDGTIDLEVAVDEGSFAYLNALKIVELNDGFPVMNTPPAVAEVEPINLPAGTFNHTLNVLATDSENDHLTYEFVQLVGEELELISSENELTIEGLQNGQNYTIKVIVSDVEFSIEKEINIQVAASLTQEITAFELMDSVSILEENIALSASSTSELPIEFSLSDETLATLETDNLTPLKSGLLEITAHQNGNHMYAAANPVTKVLKIYKEPQSLQLNQYPDSLDKALLEYNLPLHSEEGLPLKYLSSNEDILSIKEGNIAELHTVGEVQLIIQQEGDHYYLALEEIQHQLIIMEKNVPNTETVTSLSYPIKNDVLFYPNPSSGLLKINTSFDSILIYNYEGKKVFESKEQRPYFELGHLPSGGYIIHLEIEGNRLQKKWFRL